MTTHTYYQRQKRTWKSTVFAGIFLAFGSMSAAAQDGDSSSDYVDAANLFIDAYGATQNSIDVGDFAEALAPVILEGIFARYGITDTLVDLLFPGSANAAAVDYDAIGNIVEEKLQSHSEREAIKTSKENLKTYHMRVGDIAQQWAGADLENRKNLTDSLEEIYNIISTDIIAGALTKAMCNLDPAVDGNGGPMMVELQRCTVSTTDTHAGYRLWGSAINLRLAVSAMLAEANEQNILTGHTWETVERDADLAWRINWGYRDTAVLTRYLGCSQHSAVYDNYASPSSGHNPFLTENYGHDSTCRSMLPIVRQILVDNAASSANQGCVCNDEETVEIGEYTRTYCVDAELRDKRPNTGHYFPYLSVTTSAPKDAKTSCDTHAIRWVTNMKAFSHEIDEHVRLSQSLGNAWLEIKKNARMRAERDTINKQAARNRTAQAALGQPRASEGYIGRRLKKYWFFNRSMETINLMPHDKNGVPQSAQRIWVPSEQVFEIEGSTVPFHINEWWGVYKGNTFVCNFKPVDTIDEDEYHGPYIESLDRRPECNLERW